MHYKDREERIGFREKGNVWGAMRGEQPRSGDPVLIFHPDMEFFGFVQRQARLGMSGRVCGSRVRGGGGTQERERVVMWGAHHAGGGGGGGGGGGETGEDEEGGEAAERKASERCFRAEPHLVRTSGPQVRGALAPISERMRLANERGRDALRTVAARLSLDLGGALCRLTQQLWSDFVTAYLRNDKTDEHETRGGTPETAPHRFVVKYVDRKVCALVYYAGLTSGLYARPLSQIASIAFADEDWVARASTPSKLANKAWRQFRIMQAHTRWEAVSYRESVASMVTHLCAQLDLSRPVAEKAREIARVMGRCKEFRREVDTEDLRVPAESVAVNVIMAVYAMTCVWMMRCNGGRPVEAPSLSTLVMMIIDLHAVDPYRVNHDCVFREFKTHGVMRLSAACEELWVPSPERRAQVTERFGARSLHFTMKDARKYMPSFIEQGIHSSAKPIFCYFKRARGGEEGAGAGATPVPAPVRARKRRKKQRTRG